MWEKTKRSLDESMPRLVTSNRDYQQRELMKSVLPRGCNLMEGGNMGRRTGATFGASLPSGVSAMGGTTGMGGGNTSLHMMRPYDVEVESPDRQFYPQDRLTANRYWRLFHKYDPVFGTAIDLFCEMIVSDFELIIEDDPTKSIKDSLEYMNQTVGIQDKLKHLIREYLVIGEAIPHNFFNSETNLWDFVTMHNPDMIDVKDINLVNCDPIINFVPDQNLKAMLSDGSPESREFRQKLPPQFVSKVLAGQKIRLNPVNCSFIARRLHAYDLRGCSIASRLFRILMCEDAIFASSIAMYRRSASPLKVAKLGDSASGWIPSPAVESKLADLLARAETDPQAWLIWNYGINFEAFGTNDRATTIGKELNTINELKFLGLGLSKSFMVGDSTFASSKAGLQVFLRRLLSMRQFIESIWLYPKYFRPICEINEWVKAIPSEVTHRYRVKRTAQEINDQKLLLIPKLQWKNRLDPSIDSEILNSLNLLKSSFGYKVSKSTLDSFTGLDWASETRKSVSEWKQEQETVDTLLGATLKEKYNEQNAPKAAAPPGAPGSGAKPPAAGGKPPGPGSGAGSFPPGVGKGEGEAAPGGGAASLNMAPENPSSGGIKQTIE
jgi:hypothetical protein